MIKDLSKVHKEPVFLTPVKAESQSSRYVLDSRFCAGSSIRDLLRNQQN